MLDSYICLQIRNLRNLIDYLIELEFDKNHDISLDELYMLDFYLQKLERSIT